MICSVIFVGGFGMMRNNLFRAASTWWLMEVGRMVLFECPHELPCLIIVVHDYGFKKSLTSELYCVARLSILFGFQHIVAFGKIGVTY